MRKYLAFDCAGDELIVGAFNGEKYHEHRVIAQGTENLLPVIDKVLKKLKMTIHDIELVCVGIGPGSWTGARVAVVTAYGLSEGCPAIKFIPFNSFDLISYNESDTKKTLKVVKAYANFVYIQNEMGEISVVTREDLRARYGDYKLIGVSKATEDTEVVSANLKSAAMKMLEPGKVVSIDEIEPMYLRLSQAEYQREKRLKEELSNGNKGN